MFAQVVQRLRLPQKSGMEQRAVQAEAGQSTASNSNRHVIFSCGRGSPIAMTLCVGVIHKPHLSVARAGMAMRAREHHVVAPGRPQLWWVLLVFVIHYVEESRSMAPCWWHREGKYVNITMFLPEAHNFVGASSFCVRCQIRKNNSTTRKGCCWQCQEAGQG